MDYSAIIKKSWHHIKSHRVLWWLGIIAALTEGTSGGGSSSGSGDIFENINNSNSGSSSATAIKDHIADTADHLPQVLGTTYQDSYTKIINIIEHNIFAVIIISVFFLLIMIAITYLSYSAKAALILSVDDLESNKSIGKFANLFNRGKNYGWKIYGLNIMVAFIIFVALIIFASPIIYIFTSGSFYLKSFAIISAVIGLLIIGILALYFNLIIQLAERIIVLKNSNVFDSFSEARYMVSQKFSLSIVTWLVNMGLNILFGIIIALIFIAPLALIFGFLLFGYSINYPLFIIPIIAGCVVLFALVLFIRGIFTAFTSSYWTISYRALDYLANTNK